MEHEEDTREHREAKEFFEEAFSPDGYPRPLPGLSRYINYYEWGSHPEDRPSKDEPARINQQFRISHRMFKKWESDQHKQRMAESEAKAGGEGRQKKVSTNTATKSASTASAHAGNRPVPQAMRNAGGRQAAQRSGTIEDTGKKGPPLKGGRVKRKGRGRG